MNEPRLPLRSEITRPKVDRQEAAPSRELDAAHARIELLKKERDGLKRRLRDVIAVTEIEMRKIVEHTERTQSYQYKHPELAALRAERDRAQEAERAASDRHRVELEASRVSIEIAIADAEAMSRGLLAEKAELQRCRDEAHLVRKQLSEAREAVERLQRQRDDREAEIVKMRRLGHRDGDEGTRPNPSVAGEEENAAPALAESVPGSATHEKLADGKQRPAGWRLAFGKSPAQR